MCDLSGKLVAWIDAELGENDAAEVERHIQNCGECRSRVEAYGDVSRLVVTYCEVHEVGAAPRKLPRWVPALAGMAAAAAVLLFILRPAPVRRAPVVAQVANPVPALALGATSAPGKAKAKTVHRRHEHAAERNVNAAWAFAGPDIQVSIPAEAMFPPGAAPEGAIFRANLSVASDGSVQGLRLLQ